MEDMEWFTIIISCQMPPNSITLFCSTAALKVDGYWNREGLGIWFDTESPFIGSWIHMEDMEWFRSIIYCHISPNRMTFAQDFLVATCQMFLPTACKRGMAWNGKRERDLESGLSLNHH
jgi:hypothetical protein